MSTPDIIQLALLPEWTGKAAFMSVFALLILILLFLPASMLNQPTRLPKYRQARFWAILIALIQILVYARWG